MRRAPYSKGLSGCSSSRLRIAVVPTTSVQSATASATVSYSSALASRAEAPTAERASRNAASYGFTTRRRRNPKLLMARAAAPMLRGLRVATRTTRRRSNSGRTGKRDYSKSHRRERVSESGRRGRSANDSDWPRVRAGPTGAGRDCGGYRNLKGAIRGSRRRHRS